MTPRSLIAPARLAGQSVLRSQSDERLVDLVRAGSEPAFEAIVTRYRRQLLRYCTRLLPEERAEDVVQQAFVRAYDAMRDSSAELRLRPWLYRIAHNTALNALRDRGLRHEELDDNFDGVERPDQALERRLGLREVLGAVQELPERQRDAIVLRELEGRSYDQIADELGVTDGAVRQLLNRARHSVRAAATAVVPPGLLTRLPWADSEPVAARVAELSGGAGAGAVVAKVCATALITGAVVGGVATAPDGPQENAAKAKPPAEEDRRAAGQARPGSDAREGSSRGDGGEGSGRGEAGDDRSGRRGGEDRDDDGDSSGPGSGGVVERRDSSGPGSGDEDDHDDFDSSGPGSGDSGDSSGSGSSGSGSSGSGSSGSDSSGSGSGGDALELDNSGSGAFSSGSGSSGSGHSGSGSGSSGSGSGSGGGD